MAPRDLMLALIVIVVWGLNFVVIRYGLDGLPPMLLGGLRFTLVAIPAVFFIRRPNLPLRWLIAYGATISLGQFAFLFEAMANGMPAGLASLVLQSQAFFTLFFAALFIGERLRAASVVGLLVAAGGLAMIGLESDQATPLVAVLLTLCAASMWAMGNIITRRFGNIDLVALVIWGALDSAAAVLCAVAVAGRAGADRTVAAGHRLEVHRQPGVPGRDRHGAGLWPVEQAAVALSGGQGGTVFVAGTGGGLELLGLDSRRAAERLTVVGWCAGDGGAGDQRVSAAA